MLMVVLSAHKGAASLDFIEQVKLQLFGCIMIYRVNVFLNAKNLIESSSSSLQHQHLNRVKLKFFKTRNSVSSSNTYTLTV
jgi:hypothetical protein